MKKVLLGLISAMMITLFCGISAMADGEINYGEYFDPAYVEVDGVKYGCIFDSRQKKLATILEIETNNKEVEIPEYITYYGEKYKVETIVEIYLVDEGGEDPSKGYRSRGSIEKLVLPNGIRIVDIEGWGWKNLKRIEVPASVKCLDFNGYTRAKVIISPQSKKYQSKGNGIYTNKGKRLVDTFGTKKTINIAKGTTIIANSAFNKNTSVERVTMANTVKVIEDGKEPSGPFKAQSAFAGCKNLKTVVCSANLQKIGKNAFKNCKSLSKIYINNIKQAPEIDKTAFKGAAKGIRFYVKNEKVAAQLNKNLKGSKAKGYKIIVKR